MPINLTVGLVQGGVNWIDDTNRFAQRILRDVEGLAAHFGDVNQPVRLKLTGRFAPI
jgi:hypothetical protein